MKLDVKDGLYEVLGVSKDATQTEIKKAYMKMALKLHPDKNPDDEAAKERFQTLQRVYAVLRDPERRKVYDQTGSLEDTEELSGGKFEDLYEYYRGMFKKVEEEDVIAFENEYRGSDEEAADLIRLYKKNKGDMPVVFEWMLCSRPDVDSHRFADAIESAIEEGSVKRYKCFDRWVGGVRSRPAPKNPLKKSMPKKQQAPGMDLVAMIRGKGEKQHNDFISGLAAKYGGGNGAASGRKKKASKEPSDEQFLAAQSRILKKTGKKTKNKA
mmetsp:Transcript_35706/g.63666  ORF Transcript_35706/g.63666 Transcript_35706/m.63666 type:complete len:269 (-) Transcript_35706:153-959(-)|eukprot:CAMPEP_0177771616 /NCGR_PEP_ID=MMETSP0491_2-20121128/11711_1 /TAXON_ID=63592 /ORGANISM="Tetraselmis chuii, Strain PLY429" /LENGTH=268 /DNA_ID=CAMNT_0019289225 /DNA_START=290 /DNA_END=1096 /DNA_ORIENTATION=+